MAEVSILAARQATVRAKQDVHVWLATVDRPRQEIDGLRALLTGDELARGNRFLRSADRDRFLLRRVLRRLILARYLRQNPCDVEFVIGDHGKPAVGSANADDVRFNESESEGQSVLAVTWGREVGVDIERVTPNPDVDEIVARFADAHERASYERLARAVRQVAFYRWWTAKEAWMKATGHGLSALDAISIDFEAVDQPFRGAGAADWRLSSVTAPTGFVASLVVGGSLSEVRQRRWRWSSGQYLAPLDKLVR